MEKWYSYDILDNSNKVVAYWSNDGWTRGGCVGEIAWYLLGWIGEDDRRKKSISTRNNIIESGEKLAKALSKTFEEEFKLLAKEHIIKNKPLFIEEK